MGAKLFEDFFGGGIVLAPVRLLGLRGQAGGTEGGRRVDFS